MLPGPTTTARARRQRAGRPLVGLLAALMCVVVLSVGCGGPQHAVATADLAALPQPTPDPTLDAVIRGLPQLAPVAAGAGTPTPQPTAPPASSSSAVRAAATPTRVPAKPR
jgi:hypothetical protein